MPEITSANDIFELNLPISSGKVLFRGQNIDKPLLPNIARVMKELNLSDPLGYEKELLENFKRISIPYLQPPYPSSPWDWLSIARHYGLPTRLLDWTTNAFIALWFVVSEEPKNTIGNGVLWTLPVSADDLKSPELDESPFELRRTYIFQPSHINRRISAQSGWFSVHKFIEGNRSFISLEKNKSYKNRLKKYKVAYESFPKIRKELKLMGLNKFSIYQDLNTLCQSLIEELNDRIDIWR